jgi:hypothetical protein
VPRLGAAIEAGEHYGPGVILHRHDKYRRHWLDLLHFIRHSDLPNADRSEAELIKAWVFSYCLEVPGFQNAVMMELLDKISDDGLEVDDSIVKHAYTTAVGSPLRVLIAEELLDQRNNIYPEDYLQPHSYDDVPGLLGQILKVQQRRLSEVGTEELGDRFRCRYEEFLVGDKTLPPRWKNHGARAETLS